MFHFHERGLLSLSEDEAKASVCPEAILKYPLWNDGRKEYSPMSGKEGVVEQEIFADGKVFHNLCDKHRDILDRFFHSKCVPPDDVEDLVQETLVLLWSKQENIHAGKFTSFMFGIASKLALEYQRERHQKFLLAFDEELHSQQGSFQKHRNPFEKILAKEDVAILGNGMSRLSSRMRQVIELVYYEGYSHKDAARKMGITQRTVGKFKRRAKGHLKRILSKSRV